METFIRLERKPVEQVDEPRFYCQCCECNHVVVAQAPVVTCPRCKGMMFWRKV